MEDSVVKEIKETINKLILTVQTIEERVTKLENGDFGTGIFVEGCSEETKKFLATENKKEGE